MSDFLSALRERGLIHQTSDDETDQRPLEKLLAEERVTAYIGFDPTAPSLTVGNLVQVILLAHLQRSGHRPIVLMGGGTGLVGDPSGKTEMRKLLDEGAVAANLAAQREQISRYLDLAPSDDPKEERGIVLNNADWLLDLHYLDFLRDVGRHFSVNRMLAAEGVKLRLASPAGLSFLEFNYSLLQAYDYLVLSRKYGCALQMGGSDQWGNIVAGLELIRRADSRRAHALTTPLITTASGQKMGKTEKGAIWLDAERTSPYDYYQFWVNTDDRDAGRYLRVFTFLDLGEIEALDRLEGADIRKAKEVLAFEATRLTHGEEEAKAAQKGARALFGGGKTGGGDSVPTYAVPRADLESGISVVDLSASSKLCDSRNDARRQARQGGLYLNGESVDEDRVVTAADLVDGEILLRRGKKRHMKIVPE